MEKRLNLLFDHLNNEDLLKPDTVQQMVDISYSVQGREMDRAAELVTEMIKTKLETEGGNWMVSLCDATQALVGSLCRRGGVRANELCRAGLNYFHPAILRTRRYKL